ncbi:MAG: putative sugar kinase [Methanonatronarchaeales archaeon]|nr:putative sugar kinase [Methanonatronarchaeales archaeon]
MLAAFGDSFVDVIVRTSGEARGGTYDGGVEVRPGGCANVPVWVARDGGDAELYAIRGDDPFGEFFERAVTEEGVGHGLKVKGGPTGLCVSIAEAGERTMYTRRGVNDSVEFGDVEPWLPSIEEAEILFVRGYALRRDPMRSVLLELLESLDGPEVWFNPGSPNLAALDDVMKLLPMVDLVVLNEAENEALTEKVPIEGLLSTVREVVITRGPGDAEAYAGGSKASVPPEPVEVVDATGAGDAFASGYASAYMEGEGMEGRLRNGHRLAGMAVSRLGAI